MQQLLDIEKMKREETRFFIAKEKQRLGEYVQTRDCTKFDETWQEGTEFKKIEERLVKYYKLLIHFRSFLIDSISSFCVPECNSN